MSSLTYIEKQHFNYILRNNGYVLDFTNHQFQQFFNDYGVDIFAPRFSSEHSGSKGKCLNTFMDIEKDHIVAPVLNGLLEYRECYERIAQEEQRRYEQCVTAIKKLENSATKTITTFNLEKLSHNYIQENMNKCNDKIQAKDYSGAITNARSLIEHLLEYLHQQLTGNDIDNDNLLAKYKALSQKLNLDPAIVNSKVSEKNRTSAQDIKQLLSGFVSILSGVACFSNNWADRHARKFDPQKHHAQLAVNSAFTICDFLLSSFEYQYKCEDHCLNSHKRVL